MFILIFSHSLQDNPPYDQGAFRIEINFPAEYPFKPPKITFKTKIYHPNIDEKGQVCLPVISAENWKPATKTDQGKACFLCLSQVVLFWGCCCGAGAPQSFLMPCFTDSREILPDPTPVHAQVLLRFPPFLMGRAHLSQTIDLHRYLRRPSCARRPVGTHVNRPAQHLLPVQLGGVGTVPGSFHEGLWGYFEWERANGV